MKQTVPKVSIGMPVYNGEPFIREALDSLLAQTFTDFELIISDNASTDMTEAICREYTIHDRRIRYVRQEENFGALANFRFVLDEAIGEYFMWAAADDVQHENFLQSLVQILDKHNQFVLASSSIESIDNCGVKLWDALLDSIYIDDAMINPGENRKLFFRNPISNVFFSIYGLYRKEVLKSADLNYKGMVKYLSGSEIPLLAQVALKGMITSIPQTLKKYRRHPDSVYYSEQNEKGFFLT